jgi:uncharacterized membrane protein
LLVPGRAVDILKRVLLAIVALSALAWKSPATGAERCLHDFYGTHPHRHRNPQSELPGNYCGFADNAGDLPVPYHTRRTRPRSAFIEWGKQPGQLLVMMIASPQVTTATKRQWLNSLRWLSLGSLALNLFFVGVAVAIAVRAPVVSSWDSDIIVRIERLATRLPPADAALLRGRFENDRDAIEKAQSTYVAAQDEIRETLRQTPFDIEAMGVAMVKTRAARQNFEGVIQGVFAGAAQQMSPVGRHALADGTSRS